LAIVDASMIADTSTAVNTSGTGGRVMAGRQADAAGCCPPVLEAPLDESDATELAQAFAALADPIRLRLLNLVATAGEVCSCELMAPLGRSQPTVSHHTKVLADAGLITGEKRGRWVWWSIVPERVAEVRDALASPVPTR
jgi:ArsR family transcriptional regulator